MNQWDDVSKEDFRDETMSFLVDVLGLDAAKKIIEIFGGDSIYVPKAESIIRTVRDRRIYKDFKQKNYSYRALGAKYHLSVPHIRVIINTQRKMLSTSKEHQMELF